LPLTVTKGSVSGLGRSVPINGINRGQMVQTDAPVNPGNSGGPLLSADTGEVIGLVDLGATQANGIAFAVSAQVAQPLFSAWRTAPQAIATPACSNPAPAQNPAAAPEPSQSSPDAPASVIESHLQDINSGDYSAAFGLMSTTYRAQNPSWPSDRAAANPAINIISIGASQYGAGTAQVPVDFYARDRNATQGSDTQCREFQGTVSLVNEAGAWRYDPGANSLTGTVASPGDPSCPA
jgi:hypothetical protein